MNKIIWKDNEDIVAGTTLRDAQAKEDNNMALHVGGNLTDVIANRQRLSEDLGISLNQWVFTQQTHSDHMHEVTKADAGKGSLLYVDGIADCDALYTKESHIALGVFHADCVPVLLYDPFTHLIAAIHSGWQGTVKEITRKSVAYLLAQEGVQPAHLHAYIGPAINYHSFEVGQDVIEKVQQMSFDTSAYITYLQNGKALVNNKGLNKAMLLQLGVPEEQITVNKNDTFQPNVALFSYRRDHDCGRHLSFIMMKR